MELSTYIQNLDFNYMVSYSGLRGEAWERLKTENRNKIKQLERDMETARYMQKPKLGQEIQALLDEIDSSQSRIIRPEGKLHQSAVQVRKFEKGNEELKPILDILNTPAQPRMVMGCIPVFRDVLAFYSKQNEIVGVLHICFECCYIRDENDVDLKTGVDVYDMLKKALTQIGHSI